MIYVQRWRFHCECKKKNKVQLLFPNLNLELYNTTFKLTCTYHHILIFGVFFCFIYFPHLYCLFFLLFDIPTLFLSSLSYIFAIKDDVSFYYSIVNQDYSWSYWWGIMTVFVSVVWPIMPFLRSVYKIAIQDYWPMGIALGLFCRLFMSIMIIFECVFNGHSGLFLLLSTFWSTIIVFIVSTLGRIRLILVCNRVIYLVVYQDCFSLLFHKI